MTEVVVNNKMPASEPHHTEDAASFSYPSPVKEFVINFANICSKRQHGLLTGRVNSCLVRTKQGAIFFRA